MRRIYDGSSRRVSWLSKMCAKNLAWLAVDAQIDKDGASNAATGGVSHGIMFTFKMFGIGLVGAT